MSDSVRVSNPADRKKIADALNEISNAMYRIQGEKDYIKETVDDLSKKFDINKKILNRMARIHYKQAFLETVAENDEFETLYENIMNSVKAAASNE